MRTCKPKSADYRYCKIEETDQIGYELLRIQEFHEPEKYCMCRTNERIVHFDYEASQKYEASLKTEGKKYTEGSLKETHTDMPE